MILNKIINEFNLPKKKTTSHTYEIREHGTRELVWQNNEKGSYKIESFIENTDISTTVIEKIIELIKEQDGQVIQDSYLSHNQWFFTKIVESYLISITRDASSQHLIIFHSLDYNFIPWKNIRDLFIERMPFIINQDKIIQNSFPKNKESESNLSLIDIKELGKYLMARHKDLVIQGQRIKNDDSEAVMILKMPDNSILILDLDAGATSIEFII